VNNYIEIVNEKIDSYINSIHNPKVQEAISYILKGNGKRLRPCLVLACADHLNLELEKVKDSALAIEMVHTYSLIHDDLPCMDNDDYRRGKLTLHKKYDEAFALLIGDILLSDAFDQFYKSTPIEVSKFLSKMIGNNGMALGQILDMEFETKDVSIDDIKQMYSLKTGCLFAFCLSVAPICLGLDHSSYLELGLNLGIAFQLKDDIDDFINGRDENKKTICTLYSLEENQKELEKVQELINTKIIELKIKEDSNLYQIIQKIAF